jgi:DNA-binding CsgD family transcriptional regulator
MTRRLNYRQDRPLTRQQVQLLVEIAEGRTTAATARRLGISEAAVRGRLLTIFARLGAASRAQAVYLARDLITAQMTQPGASSGGPTSRSHR